MSKLTVICHPVSVEVIQKHTIHSSVNTTRTCLRPRGSRSVSHKAAAGFTKVMNENSKGYGRTIEVASFEIDQPTWILHIITTKGRAFRRYLTFGWPFRI